MVNVLAVLRKKIARTEKPRTPRTHIRKNSARKNWLALPVAGAYAHSAMAPIGPVQGAARATCAQCLERFTARESRGIERDAGTAPPGGRAPQKASVPAQIVSTRMGKGIGAQCPIEYLA